MEKENSQEDREDNGQRAVLRTAILDNPDLVLEDHAIMYALTNTTDRQRSSDVVDLRAVAMERMQARLGRIEDTHRSVVAAAYENLAGTHQVHRAILRMLDPTVFEDFLHNLGGDVAETLRVDHLCLVLESAQTEDDPAMNRLSDILRIARPGYVRDYLSGGKGGARRTVVLRHIQPAEALIYGGSAAGIRSEAALLLDLGEGRLPGMLAMGSKDPHRFRPSHGTDLLSFFAAVFERAMRRWLA